MLTQIFLRLFGACLGINVWEVGLCTTLTWWWKCGQILYISYILGEESKKMESGKKVLCLCYNKKSFNQLKCSTIQVSPYCYKAWYTWFVRVSKVSKVNSEMCISHANHQHSSIPVLFLGSQRL